VGSGEKEGIDVVVLGVFHFVGQYLGASKGLNGLALHELEPEPQLYLSF